jgi:hypothetical protein
MYDANKVSRTILNTVEDTRANVKGLLRSVEETAKGFTSTKPADVQAALKAAIAGLDRAHKGAEAGFEFARRYAANLIDPKTKDRDNSKDKEVTNAWVAVTDAIYKGMAEASKALALAETLVRKGSDEDTKTAAMSLAMLRDGVNDTLSRAERYKAGHELQTWK